MNTVDIEKFAKADLCTVLMPLFRRHNKCTDLYFKSQNLRGDFFC